MCLRPLGSIIRHVSTSEDNVVQRVLDLVGFREDIELIVAHDVVDVFLVADPDQAIADVWLDDMFQPVATVRSREDSLEGGRPQVHRKFSETPVQRRPAKAGTIASGSKSESGGQMKAPEWLEPQSDLGVHIQAFRQYRRGESGLGATHTRRREVEREIEGAVSDLFVDARERDTRRLPDDD